jgi:hypothetical protein
VSRRSHLRKAQLLACLCLNLLFVFQAFGLPLNDAKSAFSRGDLPSTVKILEPELFPRVRLKGKDLESARGLYGIAQFMVGNKSRAETSFKDMLRANPSAKLDRRYLLDPAVEPFFEGLKGKLSPTSVRRDAPKSARQKSPAAPRPGTTRASPTKNAPRSAIKVKVNAPRATVFADGIFIGSAGQEISLEPGLHEISISAEGYNTQEKRVKIESGRTTEVKFILTKPEDEKIAALKRMKQDTSKAKNMNSPASAGSSNGSPRPSIPNVSRRGSKDEALTSSGPRRSMNFDKPLPEDNSRKRSKRSYADKYFQEPATPQYRQPPPQYSQPTTPYAAPPQYQQGYQPPYQQPFQQPYQQPYQPPYPQPYPQPQYSYPAPPAYGTAPSYSYPDPYSAPPYPATPPAQPGYGAPNPYEEEDEAGDTYQESRFSETRKRSQKKSRKKGSAAIAVLPFGAGQFQNDHTLKGVLFMLAEGGAFGYGGFAYFKIQDAEKKFKIYREDEVDLPQIEKDDREKPRQEYLTKMKNYMTYSLIAGGVIYAGGVIDALVYLDSGQSKRRSADLEKSTPNDSNKLNLALGPTFDGGVQLKFTLRMN